MARSPGPDVIRFRGDPEDDAVRAALEALDRGGAVALPTDTVYGLAARADRPDGIRRIYRLKGRDFKKPLALFVIDAAAAGPLVEGAPTYFRALAERFWPGPLTLVLGASAAVRKWGLGNDGTVGLRVSPEPALRAILGSIDVPLASTSANRSGDPDSHSGAQVLESLREAPDLLLDGGELPRRRPSTVLDISGAGPVLLRKGEVGRSGLEEACGRPVALARASVLFVCTGNTCRSPMAEGLLRSTMPKEWRGRVTVRSCGTGALPGMAATGTAVRAARKRGFDISGHRSQPLSRGLLEEADLAVAMEERHLEAARSLAPEVPAVMMAPGGVPDPIGGSLDEYLETLDLLGARMPEIIGKVAGLLGIENKTRT